ncbi:MAG: hypothetical protein H3C26_12355 [Rhodocyclaceae bacterium]|nr:hypothetical protein [Rhodocyclaceae bacterium]
MTTCATLVNSWGSPPVLQLQSAAVPAGGYESCEWLYMSGAEYASLQGATTGIDTALIALGAGGAVAMWAAGFGVGLVISTVRKFRTP